MHYCDYLRLSQALACANRVYQGKTNGRILDYCGILTNLRATLAKFAGTVKKRPFRILLAIHL